MYSALLDTDIFSDILKGQNAVVRERVKDHLSIYDCYALSVVTVMEVIKGLHKARREEHIATLMERFRAAEILTLDLRSAELAGRICGDMERTGQTIGFADPIIAAIAIRHNLTLVTGNTAHYRRIQQIGYPLRLENWREAAAPA